MLLYRYRSIPDEENGGNIDWLREIFLERKLYCPLPRELNDPFDCKAGCKIYYDRAIIKKIYSVRFPDKNLPDNNCGENEWHGFAEMISNGIDDALTEASTQFGVLSLTAKCDDILMWSHYADGHKGLCLGFDFDTERARCMKVDYSENDDLPSLFEVAEVIDDDLRFISLFIRRKSIHWKYENEWRKLAHRGDGKYIEFKKEHFKEVVFGCEMSDEHISMVLGWLDEGGLNPKLLKAEKHPGKYALKIGKYKAK